MERHGEHLIRITRFGVVNAYVVREDDGLTVVDTAFAGSHKKLLTIAEQLGAPIVRIALTHAHADHVGSLDGLAAAMPDAEISVGAREARFLDRDVSLDSGEPQAKLKGGFPKIETRPARRLKPGDRVGSLEVVASPGHTPGHVAYMDSRNRTLIAGDAFQTLGGIAVAGVVRPLFPLPAMATWHLPTALASAEALRELEPSRLAVGHGRVLESPGAGMDAAIAAARARVAKS